MRHNSDSCAFERRFVTSGGRASRVRELANAHRYDLARLARGLALGKSIDVLHP